MKPSEPSAHPVATNDRNVWWRRGLALSHGHLVPLVYSVSLVRHKTDQMDQTDLCSGRGTRVAMGVDVLARLHQQIQQVLVSMREARQPNKKA